LLQGMVMRDFAADAAYVVAHRATLLDFMA
jgi:hypothetical protein